MPQVGPMLRVTARLRPLQVRCDQGELGNRLRVDLGLDTGDWIGWGHQAGFWHCGVLAKGMAAEALARRPSGGVVHLLADQDEGDVAAVNYPALINDQWERHCHHFLNPAAARVGAAQPVARPRSVPEGLTDDVRRSMERIHNALAGAADSPSAAVQANRAAIQLAAPWVTAPARIVAASDLFRTPTGHQLLERMCREPLPCATAFNHALETDRGVARPLMICADSQSTELPLWAVNAAGSRVRVNAGECRRALDENQLLLPRAFLATGMMRMAVRGFVHGTGGERYERVGDRFWKEWLGVSIPPPSVVTADLPLSTEPLPQAPLDPRTLQFDPWRADGSSELSPQLHALRAAVEAAPRGSDERHAAYELMRSRISTERQRIAARIEVVEATWQQWQERCASTSVLAARDWAFPLHRAESLDRLRNEVQALVAADSAASGSGR